MKEIIVILLDIRSAHNVGSIFRTADGAGVKKIFLCGIAPTPLDRFGKARGDFVKVSLGAEKNVKWEYAKQITPVIKKLKREGYFICAVEQSEKSILYNKLKTQNKKIALIFGNEVKGISKSILKKCDAILEIPMKGKIVQQAHHPRRVGQGKESLNVSVAFGIAVYGIGGSYKVYKVCKVKKFRKL